MEFQIPFVGWYMVVFVDVLGQTRLLDQIKNLPDERDATQTKEFHSLLQATAGTVIKLRQCFTQSFERVPIHLYVNDLPGNEPTRSPLISHAFSDYVAFALSLNDDINKVPMANVYELLYTAGGTLLTMLSEGHAIRGAAEVGVGWPLCGGDVYGPALSRAYAIESNIAQYPRIIVGDELISCIEQERANQGTDPVARLSMAYAEECAKLIAIDHDGRRFLDYLGQALAALKIELGQDKITLGKGMIKKAYRFVIHEYQRFQNDRDAKLARRYALLKDYFECRLRGQAWMTFEDCSTFEP